MSRQNWMLWQKIPDISYDNTPQTLPNQVELFSSNLRFQSETKTNSTVYASISKRFYIDAFRATFDKHQWPLLLMD